MSSVASEATRRRTFAVIAHPDAGKSTLTEALALHAHVISEAGAVHGKGNRKSTVSDWMDMEKDRGISIASSALQFEYAPVGHEGEPYVINLVDTPGHADFSEDTYRVLSAVDAAVMLIDAAKGLEPQTLKLFRVCKARGLPIVTVVNKWDRVGREPLELVDEIVNEIDLQPTPLYWPVGEAGDFRGLAHISDEGEADTYVHFIRTAGGSTIAPEEHYSPDDASSKEGEAWDTAVEEVELLAADGALHNQELFEQCVTSPIIFASAMLNFGVHQILDTLCAIAPAPQPKQDREIDGEFSGVVFKVQAGMDRNHRDTLAFMRVVSGEFDRGMQVTHAQSGRTFSTKYALTVFGRNRDTVETAYPGDIIGLVNAGSLAPGDTIYTGKAIQYPPMPQFAPEHFRTLRASPWASTSSSAKPSTSWTPRAWCRSCATTCAATPPRSWPQSVPCSSRSCRPVWRWSTTWRRSPSPSPTPWRVVPMRSLLRRSAASAVWRFSPAATANSSRCLAISGSSPSWRRKTRT